MHKGNINRTAYYATLLVLLVGLVFSIAMLFTPGLVLIRIIPAAGFALATLLWLVKVPIRAKSTD